ncbi:hypothetical protein D3C87_1144540 [compost metagenome]
MSEVEEAVKQLREYQADQKILVEARDMYHRLYANPDFKKLIVDGFMTHECARYVQESCDPMLTAAQRADALAMAQAAGNLKRFLALCHVIGNTAEDNIRKADDDIAHALENGLEGNE